MLYLVQNIFFLENTWTFMYSVQTIRLQVECVLSLFSVVHCIVQNLLTLLGKEGDMDLFIRYELGFL